MSLTIGVVGASGKMGQEVLSVLKARGLSGFPISRKDLKASAAQLSGLIDFSVAEATPEVVAFALKENLHVVSGTTGPGVLEAWTTASSKIPILWSANMSLGVAVLKKSLESLRALESQAFDFQVEEVHHNQKKDAPSGTALALQAQLKKSLGEKQIENLKDPVSMRLGGIFGEHQVHAVSQDEHLTFSHRALSRRVFAEGAVTAALWLQKKEKGLYTLESLLSV
jgi:4-hydroxy-tetrahydrodipicolinate reductase